MNFFLEKGGIVLRPLGAEDRNAFLEWHNNPEIRSQIGGAFPFPKGWYREVCGSYGDENPPHIWMGICIGNSLIGVCGLHNVRYVRRNAEVALLIGEGRHRKKGHGTKSLFLLEEYAFGSLGMHRIYAHVFDDNRGSIRLFRKCGFCQEGVLKEADFWNGRFRDVVVFGKINRF